MIPGYYNNEKETNAQFEDGWFRTGDIVALVGERKINIIDRKKVMNTTITEKQLVTIIYRIFSNWLKESLLHLRRLKMCS
jgi:acyl-CoA synthetase (AMP-forming)/AMP-acid ligase II